MTKFAPCRLASAANRSGLCGIGRGGISTAWVDRVSRTACSATIRVPAVWSALARSATTGSAGAWSCGSTTLTWLAAAATALARAACTTRSARPGRRGRRCVDESPFVVVRRAVVHAKRALLARARDAHHSTPSCWRGGRLPWRRGRACSALAWRPPAQWPLSAPRGRARSRRS